jgi:hypothetical protein
VLTAGTTIQSASPQGVVVFRHRNRLIQIRGRYCQCEGLAKIETGEERLALVFAARIPDEFKRGEMFDEIMRRRRIGCGNDGERLRENIIGDVRPAQFRWNGKSKKTGAGDPRMDLPGTFNGAVFGDRPGNGQHIDIRAEAWRNETKSFAERRDGSHAQLPQRMTK